MFSWLPFSLFCYYWSSFSWQVILWPTNCRWCSKKPALLSIIGVVSWLYKSRKPPSVSSHCIEVVKEAAAAIYGSGIEGSGTSSWFDWNLRHLYLHTLHSVQLQRRLKWWLLLWLQLRQVIAIMELYLGEIQLLVLFLTEEARKQFRWAIIYKLQCLLFKSRIDMRRISLPFFFKILNSLLPFFHWINNVLHCISSLLHSCYLKTVLQPIRIKKFLLVFHEQMSSKNEIFLTAC